MKFIEREKKLVAQGRELKELRAELVRLRAQNESMSQGMRRCISCDYRLESRQRAEEPG